jgi:hypothetical protein
MSNFAASNEITAQKLAFNRAVMYSLIIDEHKTCQELAKLMFFSTASAFKYCKWLESYGFVKAIAVKGKKGIAQAYKAHNPDKFPWPKGYLESKNPRKEYFDSLYPDIHKELRDAIFEGRISHEVVRTHRESDVTWHDERKLNRKLDRGYLTSSMAGEFSA